MFASRIATTTLGVVRPAFQPDMRVNREIAILLELLACPACKRPLTAESRTLRCTGCGCEYPLEGDVPVLITAERRAREPSRLGRLHYAILGNPRLYDFHQAHGGARAIAARVKTKLVAAEGHTLLDIGAGTGMVAGIVPSRTRYVWLDNDRMKLQGLLSKRLECYAVLADAAHLPVADRGADWTVMVEVSHHLSDEELRTCLSETARVTRERFVFVDALQGSRLRSRALWKLDLGRFPRPERDLLDALEQDFELQEVERFSVNHGHLLCVGVPRAGSQ